MILVGVVLTSLRPHQIDTHDRLTTAKEALAAPTAINSSPDPGESCQTTATGLAARYLALAAKHAQPDHVPWWQPELQPPPKASPAMTATATAIGTAHRRRVRLARCLPGRALGEPAVAAHHPYR